MAAEAGVDYQLLSMIGFGELEQKDTGGEIVDVGQSQACQGVGELVRNDFHVKRRESLFHLAGEASKTV